MECAECGFSYDSVAPDDAPENLRAFGQRYRIPLTRGLKGDDLDANGDRLADAFAALSPADWERTFVYHEEGERTLLWVAQHTVHEGEHHLLDIGRVLRAARGR